MSKPSFRKFCQTTTLHGWGHLERANGPFRKAIWATIIFFLVIASAVYFYQNVQQVIPSFISPSLHSLTLSSPIGGVARIKFFIGVLEAQERVFFKLTTALVDLFIAQISSLTCKWVQFNFTSRTRTLCLLNNKDWEGTVDIFNRDFAEKIYLFLGSFNWRHLL